MITFLRTANKFLELLGTFGVIASILIWESRSFVYISTIPFLGFAMSSFWLCKLCYGENLAEAAKDAKELENYIKNHYRRTAPIERDINSR